MGFNSAFKGLIATNGSLPHIPRSNRR